MYLKFPNGQIKKMEECYRAFFNVTVTAVQILNRKGKEQRYGKSVGRRVNEKKAYVSLKENQSIKFGAEA